MKITMVPTPIVVLINDSVPARVWKGTTAGGIECRILVPTIGVEPEDQTAFEAESDGLHALAEAEVIVPNDPARN